MKINNLEIKIFTDSKTVLLSKKYNDFVEKSINLDVNDIYALEFAVKEMKRKLDLK